MNDAYAVNPKVPARKKDDDEPDFFYQDSKGCKILHPWFPPVVMSYNAGANDGEYILRRFGIGKMCSCPLQRARV